MTATGTTLTTGERLLRSSTLLLNASYEVLSYVETIRAMTMLVAEQVVVLRAEPDRFVHSAHLTLPWPTIVALKRYVLVPHDVRGADSDLATRAQILDRDRRTCAYCGSRASTVDHVMPQSRGGRNTWDNLVAACGPCNNRKADRTPQEAGMPLLFEPHRPRTSDDLQRMVWELFTV